MQACDETSAFMMRLRAAADRCGVAPDGLIEAAIMRHLAELDEEEERTGDEVHANPSHFFEWTR